MALTLRTLTTPAEPVVPLITVRGHLRLDHDYDDALLTAYVGAATSWLETYTNRSFAPQTFAATYLNDPVAASTVPLVYGPAPVLPLWANSLTATYGVRIDLPRAPLISVDGVVIEGVDGTDTTLAEGEYRVIKTTDPAVLVLHTAWSPASPLTVTYTAGYARNALPRPLRHAVLLLTAHLYEQRGDTDSEMPRAVEYLAAPYRLATFGESFLR